MKPSIGRIVIFRSIKDQNSFIEAPSIITKVWSDTCVNLKVFLDANDGLVVDKTSATLDEGEKPSGTSTWKWPERV